MSESMSGFSRGKRMDNDMAVRLDNLLAYIEWLKTDRVKKGAAGHMDVLSGISDRVEALSRRLTDVPEMENAGAAENHGRGRKRLQPAVARDLPDLLRDLEGKIRKMTGERAVPKDGDLRQVGEILGLMEQRLTEGLPPV